MKAEDCARAHRIWQLALPLCIAVSGCGSTAEPGVSAEISLAPAGLTRDTALNTVAGDAIELDFAAWTLIAVELVPCDSLAQRAWNWFIPSAHAHGLALPTRIATPTLQNGFASDETVLGSLTPPAGSYCQVRISLGPADADAVGLRALPRMLDLTLGISGSIRNAGAAARSFTIESTDRIEASPAIELELDQRRRSVRVRVRCDVRAALSELDFSAAAADALAPAFSAALARHIGVELDPS